MRYYTGLDVSMNTTCICILNQDGQIVFEDTVATDPKEIAATIKQTHLSVEKIAVESGSISHWLVKEIRAHGLPIVCIDSRKMSKILSIKINKTDKNDAQLIAEALRCGFYSEVHQKPEEHRDLNMLLGARRTLQDIATKLKNTIRGHLKAFGIRLGTLGPNKFIPAVAKALNDKSSYVKDALNPLLEAYVQMLSQLRHVEDAIEQIARTDEDVKLLQTILGVGPITALCFKATIGDPKRFATSRAVGAFVGLTPTQYSSGETSRVGRTSKRGPTELRYLLVGAATVLLYRTKKWSTLKAWGLKLKKKKGHKKAVVAVGRKLAITMHRMLITRQPYNPGKIKHEAVAKLMAMAS